MKLLPLRGALLDLGGTRIVNAAGRRRLRGVSIVVLEPRDVSRDTREQQEAPLAEPLDNAVSSQLLHSLTRDAKRQS